MNIFKIIMIILGIILTFFPEVYFKFTKTFFYDKHEHKKTMIVMNRVTGIAILMITVIMLFKQVFLNI